MNAPPRVSLLTVVAYTLVVLGLIRAALLVGHDPALGYGDPSSWHRVAGCVAVAPIGAPPDSAGRSRPAAMYQMAGFGVGGCYPSSDALLAAPVVLAGAIAAIASDEPEILVPVQAFGLFTLALMGILALAVTAALRSHPAASVGHAAIFFLLVADPVAMLWLNTLHPEPAALLGAYAAVAATVAIAFREGECSAAWWWILAAGLAMLGLAREQFGLLPALLVLLAVPMLFSRSRRRASMIAVVALLTAAAQLALGQLDHEEIDKSRAEANMGLLVSSSADPLATRGRLGLPAHCATISPSAWLVKPVDTVPECPEAGSVSIFMLGELAAAEPLTLATALSRVLVSAQSVVPGYLGIAAEGPIASVQDLPPRAMSFVALPSSISAVAMATVIVALFIAFPAAVVWMAWTVAREPRRAGLPVAFAMLVAIGGYVLLTTAFGEGVFAAQRHDWLGELALLAAVLLIPFVLWQLTTELLRARVAMAVLFGVVLLAAGWALWTQRQPLALGAIEKTRTRGPVLEVVGWAIDPWEVRRVYATVGGGTKVDAALGTERREIAADYPGYPNADHAGFEISIPSNAWREKEVLRVFVENRSGAVTEIDRRIPALR